MPCATHGPDDINCTPFCGGRIRVVIGAKPAPAPLWPDFKPKLKPEPESDAETDEPPKRTRNR